MKINYLKKWNKGGYCYSQQVNVNRREFIQALEKMKNCKNGNWEHDFWCSQPVEICGDVAFPTLTQRDFLAYYFGLAAQKRYLNRNTCFILHD